MPPRIRSVRQRPKVEYTSRQRYALLHSVPIYDFFWPSPFRDVHTDQVDPQGIADAWADIGPELTAAWQAEGHDGDPWCVSFLRQHGLLLEDSQS